MATGRLRRGDGGYIMVALLVGMGVTAVWMSALLPTWRQQAQRQKEADLIFRGEQYARAIALFAVKNNGALPLSIDDLVEQRYLRRKWKDPITGKDFQVLGSGSVIAPGPGTGGTQPAGGGRSGAPPGGISGTVQGGIRGVYSESTATSIRVYNNAQQYNQWLFDYQAAMLRMGRIGGAGGSQQRDGGRGGPGGDGRGRGGQRGGADQGGRRGGGDRGVGPGAPGGARGGRGGGS